MLMSVLNKRWLARAKWGLLSIALAGLVVFTVTQTPEQASAARLQPGVPLRVTQKQLRPKGSDPQFHSDKALRHFAKATGTDKALNHLTIEVEMPEPSVEGWIASEDVVKMRPRIKGPNTSLEVRIIPSASNLQATRVDGQMVVHGSLTGLLRYPDGTTTELTITTATIPSLNQSFFSTLISGHSDKAEDVPPLHLVFGDLKPTPDILNLFQQK